MFCTFPQPSLICKTEQTGAKKVSIPSLKSQMFKDILLASHIGKKESRTKISIHVHPKWKIIGKTYKEISCVFAKAVKTTYLVYY